MAFDTPDIADGERYVDARNVGAGFCERTDHTGPRVRRTADDLHRLAVSGIHHQHLEAIGGRMFFGGQDLGDDERLVCCLVIDIFDLKTDRGQPLANLVQRGIRFQMILQPGECEFHCLCSRLKIIRSIVLD